MGASLVAEPGLQGTQASGVWLPGSRSQPQELWFTGLSYSLACGILLDQGLNPSLMHWQADSLPLRYQGSPGCMYLFELWLSLGICLGVGLLGHMIALFSVFLRSLLHTVLWDSQVALW